MPRFSGPIRRSQLVGPSGVGSIIVSTDGTSLIAAGLDHWFERGDSGRTALDTNEYRIEEWRLQRELHVDHFRLPPDYRMSRPGQNVPNTSLTIPFLRFPRWHVCRWCHRMEFVSSAERGVVRCRHCSDRGFRSRGPRMTQVPFVAMCDYGHIQDFPWNEWVHYSLSPSCRGALELQATGAASLNAIRVRCAVCGGARTLANITNAEPGDDAESGERTYLSRNLTREQDEDYTCMGSSPWHDCRSEDGCGRQLRGALLSASNVYFGLTRSAIYLPRSSSEVPEELMSLLEEPRQATILSMMRQSGMLPTAQLLRVQYQRELQPYTDAQIDKAITIIESPISNASGDDDGSVTDDSPETRFRREEFRILRQPRNEDALLVRESRIDRYQPDMAQAFSRIMLVDKLRETRAQYGFNRVFAESSYDIEDRKGLLRKEPPEWQNNWLPAYLVFGEGIFLEFDETALQRWENRPEVIERIDRLVQRYERVQSERRLNDRNIGPRFVLIHTFAHLLINRLAFECGYSSASLRERLYVSSNPQAPMAGLLIYTAAGDAEGTLGGLVRMGKPGNLEPVIRRALDVARWCSSDPICMELGERGGQGPDSCNLAACHSCALLPETACEEFNRFLDRAVVIGSREQPSLGYFASSATTIGSGQ